MPSRDPLDSKRVSRLLLNASDQFMDDFVDRFETETLPPCPCYLCEKDKKRGKH